MGKHMKLLRDRDRAL